LRSILENALLDTMYELPSMPEEKKVILNVENIQGKTKPLIISVQKNAGKQPANKEESIPHETKKASGEK
jgi:ATP-dependent protease Clp ATPase subunit